MQMNNNCLSNNHTESAEKAALTDSYINDRNIRYHVSLLPTTITDAKNAISP
jgi:hypothetical protein